MNIHDDFYGPLRPHGTDVDSIEKYHLMLTGIARQWGRPLSLQGVVSARPGVATPGHVPLGDSIGVAPGSVNERSLSRTKGQLHLQSL